MQTIIVPTDFSTSAENAMYYAANLAQTTGIITAGEKKYQLFLTSTEAKSAMEGFVYDKK